MFLLVKADLGAGETVEREGENPGSVRSDQDVPTPTTWLLDSERHHVVWFV